MESFVKNILHHQCHITRQVQKSDKKVWRSGSVLPKNLIPQTSAQDWRGVIIIIKKRGLGVLPVR